MLHCHVMGSSTPKQQQHLPNLYVGGATTAPPPTPSTEPISLLSTPDADILSKLLHRLPPNLTLPSRRPQSTTCPQTVSLSEKDQLVLDKVRSAGSEQGYFQLTNHSIISQLAKSAESEALALFNLPKDQKGTCCPKNWPLGHQGYEDDDENNDEDGVGFGESFCLDGSCSIELSHLPLASLKEFTRELQKLGLKVVDLLCKTMGLGNPIGKDPTRFCSLMWLSETVSNNKMVISGGAYPFIVGLQYQLRCQKYSLLADSGWVSVLPHVDAVMVTVGDIPQVWSNGKLKKVRGRPLPTFTDAKESHCMTMSLLITLPTESTVSPIFPQGHAEKDEDDESIDDDNYQPTSEFLEERLFKSFSFEDYAWRVFHESLPFKDPLDRYRI